jgi:hypothetical protein
MKKRSKKGLHKRYGRSKVLFPASPSAVATAKRELRALGVKLRKDTRTDEWEVSFKGARAWESRLADAVQTGRGLARSR